MCKIRQINRLVKLCSVTHILERLSIIWVVPRSRIMVLKPKGHRINGNFVSFVVNLIVKTFTECLFLESIFMKEKQAKYQAKGYLFLFFLGVSQC